MKLTVKQLRGVILAMAVGLILFGTTKALFKYDLGPEVEKWISQGLFFGAAIAFVYMFQLRKKEREEAARKAAGPPGAPGAPAAPPEPPPRRNKLIR